MNVNALLQAPAFQQFAKFEDLIAARLPALLKGQKSREATIISNGNALVFQLPEYPELVFITNGSIERRFQALINGRQVCVTHNLDRLVIPHAKKFSVTIEGKKYELLAEEKLQFNANAAFQEDLYYTHTEKLRIPLQQLAVFVAKTGFSDVNWRNIPLITRSLPEAPQIALFDIEDKEGECIGYFGKEGRGGQFRLGVIGAAFTEEQIDMILEQVDIHGITNAFGFPIRDKEKQAIKAQRLNEIKEKKDLIKFYSDNKITGKEPISTNFHDKVTDDIVAYINHSIQISEEPTLKGMRMVNILTGITMYTYDTKYPAYVTPFTSIEEEEAWYKKVSRYHSKLERAIDALIEGGHIFQVIREHGDGILIQA